MIFRKVQHIHFVGIGGAGMSGIAEILLNMGFQVSGSDRNESEQTRRLASMGGKIYLGHDPRHVEGAEVLVYSSAVGPDNVEVLAARAKKVPVIPRGEMLAELMRLRYGIAVAGAHGKTTTTTMIATVLAQGGLDPTAVIGGKVNSFGSHAKKGEGDFLVAEADESDGSFLKLSPTVAVVTNIDREHLDYYKTFEAIQATFLDFINKIPFYGLAVLCGDEKGIVDLIPRIGKRFMTYGLAPGLDLAAEEMTFHPWKTTFRARFHGAPLGLFELPVPGKHNVLNALAAIGVALELEIPTPAIQKGLAGYRGVERRFQLKGEKNGIVVIDDYGHHPTEIRATLAAAKAGWGDELIVVFQPHRFTRTRDCLEDLAGAFADADHLILTDIYPAGEAPIPGIDGKALHRAVLARRHPDAVYLEEPSEIVPLLKKKGRPGMMIVTLGAGDIWKVGKAFLSEGEETN
ncbi:MAG TPA: UDP-N-acetylmuramate--L-alanine ligase [Candidatus Manganitrophaceae bacterium]|nr:UDP-N-acetylmuramate--L-alanine ligase [Candidatus Manganitrophaceae bacterium]